MPSERPRNSRNCCRTYDFQRGVSIQRVGLADWFALQDENAHSDALRSIQENSAKVESEKKKADGFEEKLRQEERVLEGIRDRLEGMSICFSSDNCALIGLADKTLVFRNQIEQKQKELQFWKTKINQKQAEVDVKIDERDMLVKRVEAVKQGSVEAQEALETVKGDQKAKVRSLGLSISSAL